MKSWYFCAILILLIHGALVHTHPHDLDDVEDHDPVEIDSEETDPEALFVVDDVDDNLVQEEEPLLDDPLFEEPESPNLDDSVSQEQLLQVLEELNLDTENLDLDKIFDDDQDDEENLLDQESDADSDDSSEDFVSAHEGLDDMDTEADFVTEEDSESFLEGLDDTDTEAEKSICCECDPYGYDGCHPDCCEDFEDLELEDSDDVEDEDPSKRCPFGTCATFIDQPPYIFIDCCPKSADDLGDDEIRLADQDLIDEGLEDSDNVEDDNHLDRCVFGLCRIPYPPYIECCSGGELFRGGDDEIRLADQDLIDEGLVGDEDLDRFNPHPYTPVPTCHKYCEVCDPYNPYDCHQECCDDEEETCMEQYEHCEKEKKCKHDDHQDPYHQGRFFLDVAPKGKCAKHCQYVSYNKYHGCLDECHCKEKCNKGPAYKLKECLWKCPCKKCDHLKHDQYKHKDCFAQKCLKPKPHYDDHKDPYHSEDYSHHEKPKPKGLLPLLALAGLGGGIGLDVGFGLGGGVGLGGVLGGAAAAAAAAPGGAAAARGDCAKQCQYVSYNQYHGCLDECKCKKKCNKGPAYKLKECLWKCPCKKCDHLKHDEYKHKDCVARKCLKPKPHDPKPHDHHDYKPDNSYHPKPHDVKPKPHDHHDDYTPDNSYHPNEYSHLQNSYDEKFLGRTEQGFKKLKLKKLKKKKIVKKVVLKKLLKKKLIKKKLLKKGLLKKLLKKKLLKKLLKKKLLKKKLLKKKLLKKKLLKKLLLKKLLKKKLLKKKLLKKALLKKLLKKKLLKKKLLKKKLLKKKLLKKKLLKKKLLLG